MSMTSYVDLVYLLQCEWLKVLLGHFKCIDCVKSLDCLQVSIVQTEHIGDLNNWSILQTKFMSMLAYWWPIAPIAREPILILCLWKFKKLDHKKIICLQSIEQNDFSLLNLLIYSKSNSLPIDGVWQAASVFCHAW